MSDHAATARNARVQRGQSPRVSDRSVLQRVARLLTKQEAGVPTPTPLEVHRDFTTTPHRRAA